MRTRSQRSVRSGRGYDSAHAPGASRGSSVLGVRSDAATTHTGCDGERERALDLLEGAAAAGRGYRGWIEQDSDLAPLREEPRFRALIDRMR
jgi:hypothetical protein